MAGTRGMQRGRRKQRNRIGKGTWVCRIRCPMCGSPKPYPGKWLKQLHSLDVLWQQSRGGRGQGFLPAIRKPIPEEVQLLLIQRLRMLLMNLTGEEWVAKNSNVTVMPPSLKVRPVAAVTPAYFKVKPKNARVES